MAVALSSSKALCAGLQSTDTTWPAPCSNRFKELQPPLDSVSTSSLELVFSTCAVTSWDSAPEGSQLMQYQLALWGRQPFDVAVVPGAMAQEGTVVVMTVSECCDHIDCDTTKCRSRLITVKCGCCYIDTNEAVIRAGLSSG